MTKLKQLEKKLNSINAEIVKISFERKDTSYRRSGGYFGTCKADTTGCIVVNSFARTKHLNTYICVHPGNEAIVNELNEVKKAIAKENLRMQKIAHNKWAKDSIADCEDFTKRQIEKGTIFTNYVKIFIEGNNNIYAAHPYYRHSDYNKGRVMPNTPKHRDVAKRLNEQMIAAGLKIAE